MKIYVDPKADETLVPELQAMTARGEVLHANGCKCKPDAGAYSLREVGLWRAGWRYSQAD